MGGGITRERGGEVFHKSKTVQGNFLLSTSVGLVGALQKDGSKSRLIVEEVVFFVLRTRVIQGRVFSLREGTRKLAASSRAGVFLFLFLTPPTEKRRRYAGRRWPVVVGSDVVSTLRKREDDQPAMPCRWVEPTRIYLAPCAASFPAPVSGRIAFIIYTGSK